MKKFLIAVSAVSMLALIGCGKSEECTPELITKKTQELTTAVQEAVTKDPAKAQEIMTKTQEFSTKYAGADNKEACKAIDGLIADIKG